ncbi:MAG: hypothetical protein VKJ02_15100 [Snowella sp.]|nr:hypothetical protein [Snowella sp.]
MAGLFGIFGGKTKYVDEADPVSPSPSPKKEAFFLEPDDAQSLGNVEFMRKPITIRRTFPKTANSNGGELVQEVSSMEKKKLGGVPAVSVPTTQTGQTSSVEPVNSDRRSSDDSLDRFRQMAKDLKK